MAFIEPNPIQAANKADGQGTITIVKLLTPAELDGKCDMYAKVILPPLCSIGVHEHHGNTETYHILQGTACYNDNGREVTLGAGGGSIAAYDRIHDSIKIGDRKSVV